MLSFCFFFFNDTATTEIYTLSLHDALPILEPFAEDALGRGLGLLGGLCQHDPSAQEAEDRKSTRLNSSHDQISYAVFCLKKKNSETNAKMLAKKKKSASED